MIRRHVQAALARGILAGQDDAARAALARIDLVLRRAARRRLERSLIDAAIVANEGGSSGDPEASRHVQRVAALELAGVRTVPTDRDRVAAAYAELPSVRAPRGWFATTTIAVLVVVIGAAIATFLALRPGPPSGTYHRPVPRPAAGAFRDGGAPLRDPVIEKLLVDDFTELVLQIDRDRRTASDSSERAALVARLRDAAPITAHGPALAGAWRDMLAALERWVHAPIADDHFEGLTQELRTTVRAVSDQLSGLGIGYYLEGTVIPTGDGVSAIVYSYRVEEVVFVVAGSEPRRVLSLRRLDRINLVKTLLGMQSQELGDPVLLLDQIDEHVAGKLLPALAPMADYPLSDDEYQRSDEGRAIARVAGEAIRAELAAALGPDAARAAQIGSLLAERAAIVKVWRHDLGLRGLVMSHTDELFLPESLLDSLDDKVSRQELARVQEIEGEMTRLEAPRIASRCHQLVAATIRRHEAHHGLDDERRTPLRYPPPLEVLLGSTVDEHGAPRRKVEHVRSELAAYTSQLANDPATPQLTLWNVVRFAFTRDTWGTAESYSAVVIVDGLAAALALPIERPLVHGGEIDRGRLRAVMVQLTHIPGGRLRAAARDVWQKLYREPFVPIVDR